MKKLLSILIIFLLAFSFVVPVDAGFELEGIETSGGQFRGFEPPDFQNCILWLDGDDKSSFSFDGLNITQWNDKSGSVLGGNVIQSTPDKQPNYVVGGKNGRNVVNFDGVNDSLNGGNIINFTDKKIGSIFIVANYDTEFTSTIEVRRLVSKRVGGVTSYFDIGRTSLNWFVGGVTQRRSYMNDGTTNFYSASSVSIGVYSDFIWILNSATSNHYINNSLQITNFNFNPNGAGAIDFEIGTLGDAAGTFLPGNICEIIIYNEALNTSKRTIVTNYLKDKWGL